MARPERFELPTARFVAGYSIQLSYGRFVLSRLKPLLHFGEGGPARVAHITVPGCVRKGIIASIHCAALAAMVVRQCKELQCLKISSERATRTLRLLPEPLNPAPRLGHVVVVELNPER